MLRSLPLFPLDTVLFPGGYLPLQIFEVRYLDMVARCHQAGAPFGVTALTRGSEVLRAPASGQDSDATDAQVFYPGGTLARITALSRPQPGLMLIQCHGLQRFAIERQEQLKHGLWMADVTLLPDDQPVPIPDDLQPVAAALARVINTLHAQNTAADQMPIQPPYQLSDCAWVANRWSELLPLPLELKHRLMLLDNPLVRLELVNDLLERHGIPT